MNDYAQFNRRKRQCEHCEEMRGRQYDKVMAWGSFWIGLITIALILVVIMDQVLRAPKPR